MLVSKNGSNKVASARAGGRGRPRRSVLALAYRMKPHRPFVVMVVLAWLLPHVSGQTADSCTILEASLEALVVDGL